MAIDIIVVNWNSGDQLGRCINSISKYDEGLIGRTIIVDNGSTDGSDAVVNGLSNIDLIHTGRNEGFAKACNIGAKHSKSEFLLFLNPDAALHKGTLRSALNFMQQPSNTNVGICGVQLIDEQGHIARSCARFPSAITFIIHAIGLDRFVPQWGVHMKEWTHTTSQQVDHVIGAFFLVRHTVFDALDGFDEDFFVYLEDLDFSFRARKLGWTSYYLSDVQAFHAGGGTSQQVKAKRLFYSIRSRMLYAYKHLNFLSAIFVAITSLIIEPITRLFQAALKRSPSSLKEIVEAYAMLYTWLPKWIFRGQKR